ncbi:MAG TPA: beta-galactosidase [Gemmatimonadales bacterium]|nr:beta-galactosidase [Gemmatimonadales bacterium]
MLPRSVPLALLALCLTAAQQPTTLLTVDARTQPAPPETGWLHMGTATAPDGRTLDVNSRYLVLNGKPWLPIMGEFHFARVPHRFWKEELSKMKSAGVEIVSTYVFWNFTEKTPGDFNWTGDRDLRAFVTLCKQLGLYVFIRPGPWVHSEDRFGGLPDWVVHAMPTRQSDPEFLKYVGRWYDQVGQQVTGLLWKDGGPVIGVQVSNEYSARGPERGEQYILDLKRLAIAAGMDVPMYTVTGWDNAVVPAHEVIPLEGGYADEPWGLSTTKNPPSEVYAFRFQSRVRGTFDASKPAPLSDADRLAPHVPFFGAEFGGGVPTMYRRRPIIRPDDVAAMLPVQIGSGANVYGYYMFHGGQISPSHGEMEEKTAIGGYNDLPMIDYDFQAPLGAYGQQHAVMGNLRPYHFFVNAFGGRLAPMTVHQPSTISKGQEDLVTPRFSVRSLGNSGFLFMNNHVRQYTMAEQKDVRFEVRLPNETLTFPSAPITIPTDAYFIWPINMDLSGATLAYATAQPVTEIDASGTPTYVFMAQNGIAPEFAISQTGVARVTTRGGKVSRSGGRYVVKGMTPGTNATLDVRLRSGKSVRVLVLTEAQAGNLTLPTLDGSTHLLLSSAQAFTDGSTLTLLSTGDPDIRLAVYPALSKAPSANLTMTEGKQDGVFQTWSAHAAPRTLSVTVTPLREAGRVPPLELGPPQNTAHEPMPEVFGRSAAWKLTLTGAVTDSQDAFLRIYARGDVARLFSGVTMLDDQFLNGNVWEVGLRYVQSALDDPLTLTVLPLRKDAPIYLDKGVDAMVEGQDQLAKVDSVTVVPQYRLDVSTGRSR